MIIYKNKKGFTLIEVLLVITAIGILASIALVALNPNKQLEAGRAVKRKADMDVIAKAIDQYVVNNRGKYPPALQSVVTGGTVGLCVTSPCTGGIDLTTDLAPYISAIPLPQTGQYTITKTATGITPGYDSSTIWATAGTTAPTLDLNFARDKQLVNAVNGSNPITFTRNSIGTYVGSDGLIKTAAVNEPRFDHDPITKASQGLLIEEQRINLVIRSLFQFPSTPGYPTGWGDFNPGRVVQSVSAAPDGTGASIVGKVYGNSGGFRPSSAISLSTSTDYTITWYARKPTDSELALFLSYYPTNDTTGQSYVKGSYMRYDNTVAGLGNSSIFTLTDNWSRFSFSFNSSTSTQIQPNFTTMTQGGSYAPNDLFVIAGVQLEAGAFPTSYIPTTTSQVTRATDVASITGTNFTTTSGGGWYNQTEGTLFANFMGKTIRPTMSYDRYVAIVGSDPNIHEIGFCTQTANGGGVYKKIGAALTLNAVDQFPGGFVSGGGPDFGGRAILAYKSNDAAYTINGATPILDNSITLPTGVELRIFGRARYQLEPSGTISQLTYWPTRLSNTTLTNITK